MPSNLVPRPPGGQVDLPFRDFHADRALGRLSLYGEIANAAAEKICGLYGKSPATVARIIPAGSGLIDNSRGIFDDMCQDIAPPPPLPLPPFEGGQCDGSVYRVTIQYNHWVGVDSQGQPVQRVDRQTADVYGAIGGYRLANPGTWTFLGQNKPGYRSIELFCRGGSNVAIQPPGYYGVGGQSDYSVISVEGISVEVTGGYSDNCGNPPAQYPPPSATPDDLSGTTIINIAPNVPVTVPVTIVPTFAPVVGIFRPEFNVQVDGINVNISAGGFTFSPTLEINPNEPYPYNDPRTVKPPSVTINNGGSTDCPDVDLQPVLDKLDDIQDEIEECCDRYYPFQDVPLDKYDVTVLGEGNSGEYDLPAFSYRVLVQVLEPDKVKKSQAGLNAPDVLYAGWAWFDLGGGMGERTPIDSSFKAFEVPQRADSRFAFTMQGNTVAKVSVFHYVKPE